MLSKQWDVIVCTFNGYCLRRWLLPGHLDNKKNLVFLIRWWIKARWKGHGVIKSFDGLYTYNDRLDIPRMAQDLCILLLTECNLMLAIKLAKSVGNFVKRFLEGKFFILLDCKALSSNCFVCNCSKPIWQGSFSLHPLVVMTTPGK